LRVFVDSNIPMYVAGREHANQDPARRFLNRVRDRKVDACTSTEVLQEILYRYSSLGRLDLASEVYDLVVEICPVVLPLHPRTRKAAAEIGWTPQNVRAIRPISYLEMLLLERRARLILTDSGGVQKEAYFARVPCVTLRDETEWVETLGDGCNVLAGADEQRIIEAARATASAGPWTALYGSGTAGCVIVEALRLHLS